MLFGNVLWKSGAVSMPKIMEILGYIIYFGSNEGQPAEPIHVHISKKPTTNGTKVWITSEGNVQLEHNKSKIPHNELKRLMKTISDYHDIIIAEWKKFFQVNDVNFINDKKNTSTRIR